MELKKALHALSIEALRSFQEEALNTLLADRSLLTLMPTSAGKSLIFTSFAMVQERLTIVIDHTLRSSSTRFGSCRTRALPPPA